MDNIHALQCALDREQQARQQAEQRLKQKHHELFKAHQELKQLADSLCEQNQRHQAILEAAAEGIITFDENGIVESLNPAAERIFGFSAEEVIGGAVDRLAPGLQDSAVDGAAKRSPADVVALSQALGPEHEVQGCRKDGSSFPMEIAISRVEIGEHRFFTGIVRDVSRRKLLEGQLAHALKMESVGQLAAGIAHEINTPIQYVGDNVRFLHEAFERIEQLLSVYEQLETSCRSNESVEKWLKFLDEFAVDRDMRFLRDEVPAAIEQTFEGTERVASIVRAMREFSHPGGKRKQEIDLHRAIQGTMVVCRNEWKYVAKMVTDFDPRMPLVPCLPAEVNQAILNLIVNAAHAIAEVIGTSPKEPGKIMIRTNVVGRFAEIRVSDTGGGIPESHQSRVFDPFFTTKSVGRGTGQGLSVVYSVVVEKHGGSVDFVTREGEGTTFIMRLPLRDNETANELGQHEEANSICG